MSKKKSNEAGTKDGRTRNWTFVAYPESVPNNWRDILDSEHIQWIESPLHDSDENADGEQKKPHWHIALLFEGHKSYEQVIEVTRLINATIPKAIKSMVGLVRYMIHLDNPEKKQYAMSDIVTHGGADLALYFKPSSTTRYELIREMRQWVNDNDCTEFFKLFDYATLERFEDWFPLLCDNSAYIMGEYIKSVRNSKGIQKEFIYVNENGEVIDKQKEPKYK
jgi:hypothetical protein